LIRAIICGGRNFNDWKYFCNCLDDIHKYDPFIEIAQGGANGADTFANMWANRNKIPVKIYKPDWDKFKKAAGMIRNRQMFDNFLPDMVIAFPGNTGTQGMINYALSKNCQVVRF
jgi:hypothetical protein